MSLPKQTVDPQAPAERRAERLELSVGATLRTEEAVAESRVLDLSTSGCLVETSLPLAPGDQVTIGISGLGAVPALVVRTTGQAVGVVFHAPVPQDLVDSAPDTTTIVPLGVSALLRPGDEFGTMDDHPLWPGAVRLGIIAAAAAAGWAAIIAIL